MNSRSEFSASNGLFAAQAQDRDTLSEEAFHRMISIERRRTARSRKSFMLMLVDMGEHSGTKNKLSLQKILSTLSVMLRETDVTGWYKKDSVVGVMFTEITLDGENSVPATMMKRVSQTLKSHLNAQQFQQIGISFHLLPEAPRREVESSNAFPAVYPGVSTPSGATETSI